MIINIRGTNGSAKSTVVRNIMKPYRTFPLYGALGPKRPEANKLLDLPRFGRPVYVLGPYMTPAGGADCIQPYERIPELIRKYAALGHVIFEGIIVSCSVGKVGACLEEYGKDSVVAYLDTSLEDCLKAINGRRAERGVEREPLKRVEEHYKAILRIRENMIETDKVNVIDISRETGAETIMGLLTI
jgi:hypothetical protein